MWKLFAALAILMLFGAAGLGYMNQDKLKKDKDKLKQRSDLRIGADTTLAQTKKELKAKKEEVEASSAELAAQKTVTAEKKAAFEEKNKEVMDRQTEVSDLRTKVEKAREDVAAIGKIEEVKEILDQLQAEVADLKGKKAAQENKVKLASAATDAARKQLEAKKEKEEAEAEGTIVDKIVATISEANNEAGFVVINAGFSKGIVAGGMLQVVRGDGPVAQLRVTALEPGRAVASILKGSLAEGVTLRPGDRVESVSADEATTPATS